MTSKWIKTRKTSTRTINSESLTPEGIATLLPSSWAYTFVDIKAALHYYYPMAKIT